MKIRLIPLMLALVLVFGTMFSIDAHAAIDTQTIENSSDKIITSTRKIDGINYSVTFDLTGWKENTSVKKIAMLEEVFFDVYPQLYDRFGGYSNASTDIKIVIRDEGYCCAETVQSDNTIYLHDMHLIDDPHDYDVITHELVHIIQNCWDGNYLENTSYQEIFADYCRYIYAYKNGKYNDDHWTLGTPDNDRDDTYLNSARFFVWLDLETAASNRDIMRDFFEICFDRNYKSDEWDKAWKQLFKGTQFEGKSIGEVWEKYKKTDFAYYDAKLYDGEEKSELIRKTDVRNKIKHNSFSEKYEASLKSQNYDNANKELNSESKDDKNRRSASYEFGKNIENGRYVFNTHILDNSNMDQNKESFNNLCDALINGEDSFSCSSKDAFDLITSSEILGCYFPFAEGKIKGVGYENGVGKIQYLIPQEEFVKKEFEYEKRIEDIINNTVKPETLAFSKAISLFNYCKKNYTDELEFNRAYSFLLLQCGIPSYIALNADNKIVTVCTLSGKDYTYDPASGEFKLYRK